MRDQKLNWNLTPIILAAGFAYLLTDMRTMYGSRLALHLFCVAHLCNEIESEEIGV